MPRSDSGRAAVWGWSERSAGDCHSSVSCSRLRVFKNDQPHHAENVQSPAPLGERLPHSSPILVSGDPSCQPDGAPFDENIP